MTKEVKPFRTKYDYKPQKGQVFTEPSLTVLDQSFTVSDIIKKAMGGNLPAISRNVTYGGTSIIHSIPIDITELETSARNIKRRLDAKQQAEEEEIQRKNRIQAEIEANQKREFDIWKASQPTP